MPEATLDSTKTGHGFNISPELIAADEGIPRFKTGYITVAATADNADTIAINLFKEFRITKLMGIKAFTHSTSDSIIIQEDGTTAVVNGVLTITIGGVTANKKRFFVVYGI